MIKKLVFGSLIFIILTIGVVSFIVDSQDFLKISIGNCLTLIVALVVGYYFSIKNQDEIKKKDIYINILQRMQNGITDSSLTNITSETDMVRIIMKKRQLNNYLTTLNICSKEFGLVKEISFIEGKLNEYADLIGAHQDDKEYLAKSSKELKRPLELIETKLSEAMLKLYE